jgi:plastocyanin
MTTTKRAILAFSLFGIAACGGGGGGYDSGSGYPTSGPPTSKTPGTNEVVATFNNAFNPTSRTVTVGTTITFTFETVAHNVFFDTTPGAPQDIDQPTASTSVTRTFSSPGTFNFTCHIHPAMHGTIIVQ